MFTALPYQRAPWRPQGLHPLTWLGWSVAHLLAVLLVLVVFLVVSEDVYPSAVQLDVRAAVLKKAWVRPLSGPRTLAVGAADVARGWVDVQDATVFSVRTNSGDGFVVEVEFEPGLVQGATVSGLAVPATIGPGGGSLVQGGIYREDTRFELHWRLRLAPGTAIGVHPWPVQMTIQPA